jgi:O-antigen ligase
MLGTLFSSYPNIDGTLFGRFSRSDIRKNVFTPARRKTASALESSALCGLYRRLIAYLLSVRIKVYGAFVFSFLIYSAIIAGIGYFRGSSDDLLSVILPASLSLGAVPAFFSPLTLAGALRSSFCGRFILRITGASPERLDVERRCGRGDAAFVLALVCSLATVKFPFWFILAIPLGLCAAAIIFSSPEFGTMCLFFFVPLLPTWGLFALAAVTMASFLLKALLAKRVFRIEAVDIALLPLVITFLSGTLFGASHSSLKSGAAILAFVLCYYLTVFTLATRVWLRRCVIALVVSCSGISFYGLLQYVWQKSVSANMSEWVDEKMFGFISGRAIATLENPNMLSVYLITVIPIALMTLVVLAKNFRERVLAFVGISVTGLCLIFTWSRGAWLGLILAMMIFIVIWSRRSIYAFILGFLSLPFLSYIVPANIWARFTSIGNLSDSSSNYRVAILKSAFKFLPDFIFNGIGLGEESWNVIWPTIANEDVVIAAHSHNLYVQIWLQTGLISLVCFFVFIVVLILSNFNYYKLLRNADDAVMSHISLAPLKESPIAFEGKRNSNVSAKKKKTTMRLEAAAPLCGILATLFMGFTDYTWTNFRVMLSFWLVCGLSAGYVRVGRRELSYSKSPGSPEEAEAEILLENKKTKKELK